MNTFARARSYLDKIPGAVSGYGGHNTTFTAACADARRAMDKADRLANQHMDPQD